MRSPTRWSGTNAGYGKVADCWPQGANSSYLRMRVIVMVAVKNDLALVAAAVGPFRQFGPDSGIGKPSGRQPPNRFGHGQIREQLQLARRPATVSTSVRW